MKIERLPKTNAVSTHDGGRKRAGGVAGGFSLIEMLVVVAIVAIFAGLSVYGFQTLTRSINQRNFVTEFASALSSAKLRALATQRNVIVLIDGTGRYPAYYEIDDMSFDPGKGLTTAYTSIDTQATLATVAGAFSKSNTANYGLPANYRVRVIDEGVAVATPLVMTNNAWGGSGGTFPFPFKNITPDTTNGCTFCVAKRGAVVFRPDGKIVFSSAAANTALGGAVIFGQYDAGPEIGSTLKEAAPNRLRKAVLISVSGHMETVSL